MRCGSIAAKVNPNLRLLFSMGNLPLRRIVLPRVTAHDQKFHAMSAEIGYNGVDFEEI